MESTCKFERMFLEMLKEDNIAGAGGAYGNGGQTGDGGAGGAGYVLVQEYK